MIRSKVNTYFAKDDLDKFDKKVNDFSDKNNGKATQTHIFNSFNHVVYFAIVWYNDPSEKATFSNVGQGTKKITVSKAGKGKKPLPVYNNLGKSKEIGALWFWKKDGTLRGDLHDEKIDMDYRFFTDNAEVKEDKHGKEFYILEWEGERLLIIPLKNKEHFKQPDYRVYEG